MQTFGKSGSLAAATCALLCVLATPSGGAEDYSQWAHSGDLFLNTTPDGANVTGTVTRFPLLVRLNAGSFDFRQARKDGRDVRFADADGRHLPYQIERWDSARAVAEIWVLVDEVLGKRDDQFLRMHWGRPAAADSSRGAAVFESSNGFLGVWHLGPEAGTRPNSVGGAQAATPMGYGSDAAVPGIIGLCDSLNNDKGQEDYLQLHDEYTGLSEGFTYTVWAYPTAVTNHARLLDLGNGAAQDNILVERWGTDDALRLQWWNGNAWNGSVDADGALGLNQWQQYAVTVDGTVGRVYRNGVLVAIDTLPRAIADMRRNYQYIGKSNWSADSYFQGKLDEPTLSRTVRSADFIKLSYANQRADQKLLSFQRTFACQAKYAAPRDTALGEGRLLEISAQAECATGYTWSAVSGACPRILDPDVKTLQVYLPRVTGDETLIYRFVARFGDSVRTKDVRITVKEAIPDPVWSFDAPGPWNGRDSLAVKPVIANLASVLASRDPIIRWSWTLAGLAADTAWRPDQLVLRNPAGFGRVTVGLCLDNGGPQICRQVEVDVIAAALSLAAPEEPSARGLPPAFRDAAGRKRKAPPRWEGAVKPYPMRRGGAGR